MNKGRQWSTEYRSLDSLKPAALLAVTFVIKNEQLAACQTLESKVWGSFWDAA